jgi:hypothetical protein
MIHPISNSLYHSPSWEANSRSATKGILRLLWNPKIYYRIKNGPPLDPALSQVSQVRILPPSIFTIHFKIILPSMSRSPKWSLPFWFLEQIFLRISYLSHACYMPHPRHILDLITVIILDVRHKLNCVPNTVEDAPSGDGGSYRYIIFKTTLVSIFRVE